MRLRAAVSSCPLFAVFVIGLTSELQYIARARSSFFEHDVVYILVFFPTVLAVLSALSVSRVQPCALKQAGHEIKPLSSNVGLSSKEVEYWVGTAAHKGYGRGDSTAALPYFT